MHPVLEKIYRHCFGDRFGKEASLIMAGRIIDASQSMTRIIEGEFEQTRGSAPLFVMLGENHDRPAHKLAHMLVLRSLQDKGYKIAVGLEDPYNLTHTVVEYLKDHKQRAAGNLLAELLVDTARDDPLHVQIAVPLAQKDSAHLTNMLCRHVAIDSGIRMAFKDAARSGYNFGATLDRDDPHLRHIIRRDRIDVGKDPVVAYSPLGIHLRNKMIVEMGQDHALRRKPHIYIQLCGNHHVGGAPHSPLGDLPYKQSLTGLYQVGQHNVLGITTYLDRWSVAQPPNKAVRNLPSFKGPSFKDANDALERVWLEAVMPSILPDLDLKAVLKDAGLLDAINATSRCRIPLNKPGF